MKKMKENNDIPVKEYGEYTESTWLNKGFIVKPGEYPVKKKSWAKGGLFLYYNRKQVVWDIDKADRIRHHKTMENKRAINLEFLSLLAKDGFRFVVFDTETTGLDPVSDFILSLSWQILDANLNVLDAETYYFDNPLPEEECIRALNVNGLTNAKLSELGTSNKKEILKKFVDICEDRSTYLIVGHNVNFDRRFVIYECMRQRIQDRNYEDYTVPYFDTMTSMENHWGCRIKLSDTASRLNIDTSDIDFHSSASDVEVTVRCLRKIVLDGYLDFNKSKRSVDLK